MTSKFAELREKFNQQPHIVQQLNRPLVPRKERTVQSTSAESSIEVENVYFKATIKDQSGNDSMNVSKELRTLNNGTGSIKSLVRNMSATYCSETESPELYSYSVVDILPSNNGDQVERSPVNISVMKPDFNKQLSDNDESDRMIAQQENQPIDKLSLETDLNESDMISLESVLSPDAMFYCYTEEYPNFRRRDPRNIFLNKIKPNMKPY